MTDKKILELLEKSFGEINQTSQEAVVQASSNLKEVIQITKESIKPVEQTIGTATASLEKAIHELEGKIDGVLEEQIHEIKTALQVLGALANASGKIEKLSSDSNFLALNASIEANRLGSAGAVFRIIAGSVSDLAKEIGETSSSMIESINALEGSLPSLLEAHKELSRSGVEFSRISKREISS